MREIKIRIVIDEKTNRIGVIEQATLGIPPGIDKQLYLQGVYQYLLSRINQKIKIKHLK